MHSKYSQKLYSLATTRFQDYYIHLCMKISSPNLSHTHVHVHTHTTLLCSSVPMSLGPLPSVYNTQLLYFSTPNFYDSVLNAF